MFFAAITAGCDGGSSSNDSGTDSEQTETLNEDTGGDTSKDTGEDTGDYDPNSGGLGVSGTVTDMSTITAAYTARDGETLTGKLGKNVKISIASGATVTLKDLTIDNLAEDNFDPQYAGLTCEGNATLIIEGYNTVSSTIKYGYGAGKTANAGIQFPEGRILTIKGNGQLTAKSNNNGACIGGAKGTSCGNIVIESGNISAVGNGHCPGIGTGDHYGECGNITIDGDIIKAVGTLGGARIGTGYTGTCGDIIITNGVTKVTAVRTYDWGNSVGAGGNGTCGIIMIGGQERGAISDAEFI